MFDIKVKRGFYPLTKVRNTQFGRKQLGQKRDRDTGREQGHGEDKKTKEEDGRQDGHMIYSMPRIMEQPQGAPSGAGWRRRHIKRATTLFTLDFRIRRIKEWRAGGESAISFQGPTDRQHRTGVHHSPCCRRPNPVDFMHDHDSDSDPGRPAHGEFGYWGQCCTSKQICLGSPGSWGARPCFC